MRAPAPPLEAALHAVRVALDAVGDTIAAVETAVVAIDALRASGSASPAREALVAQLEDAVVASALAGDVVFTKDDDSPTQRNVSARTRERRFAELDALCNRAQSGAVARIVAVADMLVDFDQADAPAVYGTVRAPVWDAAHARVWLGARLRPHDVFVWLHDLAHAAGASDDLPVLERNARVTAPRA